MHSQHLYVLVPVRDNRVTQLTALNVHLGKRKNEGSHLAYVCLCLSRQWSIAGWSIVSFVMKQVAICLYAPLHRKLVSLSSISTLLRVNIDCVQLLSVGLQSELQPQQKVNRKEI